jgi:hypothetical protein
VAIGYGVTTTEANQILLGNKDAGGGSAPSKLSANVNQAVFGQNAVVTSAALAVVSTTRGFLPPVVTTAQRDLIASPTAGLTVYNSSTSALNVYNGSIWVAVGGGGGSGDVVGPASATDNALARFDTTTGKLLQDGTISASDVTAGVVTLATIGNNDLVLQTGNATTGSITITDGANGEININPNGSGPINLGGSGFSGDYILPGSEAFLANNLFIDTGSVNTSTPLFVDGNITPVTTNVGAIGSTTRQWSDLFLASGGVINWDNGNATITHSAGLLTSNVDVAVPDEAYGPSWNGSLEVPTKNAVYDRIETLTGGGVTNGQVVAQVFSDTLI